MPMNSPGIHHVTAIAGEPQRNLDFYAGILGLRLVKLTVNFDDPGTYHLYYGDGLGRPGTLMTFFPWANAYQGRIGVGQIASTGLSIPRESLDYWIERLESSKVAHQVSTRLEERVIAFSDPDGMPLELVAHSLEDTRPGWDGSEVPAEHAIHGIHSVTLVLEGFERTAALLTETMGFRRLGEDGSRFRFGTNENASGGIVDLLCLPGSSRGRQGTGTYHHVAWRTLNDESQVNDRNLLVALDLNVTPVIDRSYFHSIYFREPGGVLFEIATDPPGFTIDESEETLGTHLKLPEQYEPYREQLKNVLPKLVLPGQRELA